MRNGAGKHLAAKFLLQFRCNQPHFANRRIQNLVSQLLRNYLHKNSVRQLRSTEQKHSSATRKPSQHLRRGLRFGCFARTLHRPWRRRLTRCRALAHAPIHRLVCQPISVPILVPQGMAYLEPLQLRWRGAGESRACGVWGRGDRCCRAEAGGIVRISGA